MNAYFLVFGAAILAVMLMIFQLKAFGKNHPNAELLLRFYQIIASDE